MESVQQNANVMEALEENMISVSGIKQEVMELNEEEPSHYESMPLQIEIEVEMKRDPDEPAIKYIGDTVVSEVPTKRRRFSEIGMKQEVDNDQHNLSPQDPSYTNLTEAADVKMEVTENADVAVVEHVGDPIVSQVPTKRSSFSETDIKQDVDKDQHDQSLQDPSNMKNVPEVTAKKVKIEIKEDPHVTVVEHVITQDHNDAGETVIDDSNKAAASTSQAMERRQRRVSASQWDVMLEFVERNPTLARGYNNSSRGREQSGRLWRSLANLLNNDGSGPSKAPKEWATYFNNFKSKLKKTLSDQRKPDTEGGPTQVEPLTQLEERVLAILGQGFGQGASRVNFFNNAGTSRESCTSPTANNTERKQSAEIKEGAETRAVNSEAPGGTTQEETDTARVRQIAEESQSGTDASSLPRRIRRTRYRNGTTQKNDKPKKREPREKTQQCELCEYRCTAASTLKIHMRKHTGEKPFKCDECEYRCTGISNLRKHAKKHTEEKPYQCKDCDFRSAEARHLEKHKRKHMGERPFECEICFHAFPSMSALKCHVSTHTGEKPFKCEQCDYRCIRNVDLRVHMRVHTGEKPYKCDYCDFRCTAGSGLTKHIRIHTNEKPYKCDYCDHQFTASNSLKTHMRTHTGERPYKCKVCSHPFAVANALKNHMRTHTGEMPYKCEVCDFQCRWYSTLRTHKKKHAEENKLKSSDNL